MNNKLSASIATLALLLTMFLTVAPNAVASPKTCAMKNNEQGGLDTGVKASDFWSTGFTLSAWVMPEFVYADRGPIFGLKSGEFWVGAGPFAARDRNAFDCTPYRAVLRVRLGSESIDYVAPSFRRDQWSHVALTFAPTRNGALVRLFVNGLEVLPYKLAFDPPVPPFDACSTLADGTDPAKEFTSPEASTAPKGTLFLGSGGSRYFYGLIDDATIFSWDIGAANVASLAAGSFSGSRTTVWQEGFSAESCSGKIGQGRAVRVPVVGNASDAALFDDPALVTPTEATYHLPFAPGEVWKVIQGVDSTGSHNGKAAFSFDFALSSGQASTGLHVVRAAAPGIMVNVDESENPPDGTLESNYVAIQTAPAEVTYHRHLEHDSVTEIFFQGIPPLFLPQDANFTVPVGGEELLARVAVNDRSHLHFGIRAGRGSAYTVPMAFSDYQLMVYCGSTVPVTGSIPLGVGCWMDVSRGIPEDDTFIRRHP